MTSRPCPGCGRPDRSHDVLAECWRALEAADRIAPTWRGAPEALARIAADLPTARTLRWLRDRGDGIYPLCGSLPDGVSAPDPGMDGFYARAGAVEAARRQFHRGPIANGTVVERLAVVGEWLAVRRSTRPGTLVPRDCLDGRVEADVRVFELVQSPSGGDPGPLVADRVLFQRGGEAFEDVLFAHDGWRGERVGRAPGAGGVPADVERRLTAEMTAELL